MAKIIFTSRYLRDAPPAQLENYVRYIGTREGVEKIDESKLLLPATVNQRRLIRQLVRDIPASKDMLEYADFLSHPTIGNASEFISCALEQNLDLVAKKENYVDYIANRPRVERIGEHGLFTDAGKPVVLAKVQDEMADHKGPVWTHVISLRREDAARFGYDSAEQWMALLRSKRAILCKHMKIDSANLRWYAAFHNERHHPHVHLMVYSAKDNDGFLTETSIEAMRSELAHDIFRQDFANIYEKQNQARAELKAGAGDVLQELLDALRSDTMASPWIAEQMELLASRLQNTSGKKVYGYLKRDVKNLVDQIVDELAKDSRVDALYQAWGKWQNEILLTYQKTAPPLPPLSQQKQFKSIKNMVIAEAMKLVGYHLHLRMRERRSRRAPLIRPNRWNRQWRRMKERRNRTGCRLKGSPSDTLAAPAATPCGAIAIKKRGFSCSAVRIPSRTLNRHLPYSSRRRNPAIHWPCMTSAGCMRTVLAERLTTPPHRNGTPRPSPLFNLRSGQSKRNSAPICSTVSERCMQPVLAQSRTMGRRLCGLARRL